MITSNNSRHVFWLPPGALMHGEDMLGGWYFWDESEQLGGGPYGTERQALDALGSYAEEYLADWPTKSPTVP